MKTYMEQIEEAIAPLVARGFNVMERREDPKWFGNSLVVIASPSIRLRFISDRGQFLVGVAPAVHSVGWYDLAELLRAVGARSEVGPWDSPHAAVQEVERNGSIVTARLADLAFLSGLQVRR